MSTLSTNPRDLTALLTAGESALLLEDPRSALGFFGRADDISPNNGRIKAGLGRSMLQLEQTGDGLRLMEQAGNLGYSDVNLLADRGLARDLTGNQQGAQQDYEAALRLNAKNETVIRRYAVSLGIAGQLDMALAKIQPLLYNSDRAAWRDRAFILAMNGKNDEAEKITSRVMPPQLASAIKPYMDRMAMLSPSQRAAAVHFGQFPPGLVNMRIASAAVPVKSVDARPPQPAERKNQKAEKVAVATPAPAPARPMPSQQVYAPLPARAAPSAAAAAVAAPTPRAASPAPQAAPSVPARPQVQSPARPQQVASAPARPPVQGPPSPVAAQPTQQTVAAPAAPPPADRTLAQIMADIKVPDAERQNDVKPVNLAEIAAVQAAERKAREAAEVKARKEAARKKAEEEAKAKAAAEKKRLAANPARYWVQIGVGRDRKALGFTLRRMKKENAAIAKYDGWSASWGQTNRLVVGPMPSLAKAKDVLAELKKAGSDAFVWRSEAGEELESVGK
jgi:Flp pilus assembly protein TadD